MVDDWYRAHVAGERAVMLAVRRADVADLNRRAQAALIASGRLHPADGALVVGGDRRYLIGDELVCGRNDRRAGLINGTALTVTGVDPESHRLVGRGRDGQAVTVPGAYVDAGHVGLGYATTIHKSQGSTLDRAFLLGDDRLFAEAGYVGLSRGRVSNQIYVVANPDTLGRSAIAPGEAIVDHLCTALGVSRAQTLSTAQAVGDRSSDAPLKTLVSDRDRLTRQLTASMPPRPILTQPAPPGVPSAD